MFSEQIINIAKKKYKCMKMQPANLTKKNNNMQLGEINGHIFYKWGRVRLTRERETGILIGLIIFILLAFIKFALFFNDSNFIGI